VTLARRGIDQLLQVGNQVLQLGDLDVPLDHIARIKMTNRIDELFEGIIVLLLLIQIVSVLLGYLSDDLLRELGGLSYLLRLSK